ncbi:MAG TPA: hypothetical protein VFP68_23125, partial [Burkholderiaceae bacterium]|nr:hypothetical protein [Burkholderiaceae bacterium]
MQIGARQRILLERESRDRLLQCLTEDTGHPMIVVACGQVTNARRAFQKALADSGRPFVYAD